MKQFTGDDDVLDVAPQLPGDAAQGGEHDDAGQDAGGRVQAADHQRVHQDRPVVDLVVAGERDHRTERDTH